MTRLEDLQKQFSALEAEKAKADLRVAQCEHLLGEAVAERTMIHGAMRHIAAEIRKEQPPAPDANRSGTEALPKEPLTQA